MSYSAMPSRATGYVVVSSDWNNIVDNFIAGVPDIFTAVGDLAVASAADVAGVLALGTAGQMLVVDTAEAVGMKWATPNVSQAYARYHKATTQSLTSGATAIVDFDSDDSDTDTAVTTGASWAFDCPNGKTGHYLVCAAVALESSSDWGAGEVLTISLYVSGVFYSQLAQWVCETAGTYIALASGSTVVNLAADSDTIDIRAFQNSGAAINIAATTTSSHVAIARLFS